MERKFFDMRIRRIFAGMAASAIAFSALAVNASAVDLAEGIEEGRAYLGFADNDWIVAGWGKADDNFKIADFDVPDKYPVEENYSVSSDKTTKEWAFKPSNGDNVNVVYVRGMKTSASESHQNHLDMVGRHDENE